MEYPARIKVHAPCHAGVLVELAGEFDASCLVAFGQALSRASGLGRWIFVDLAGVKFMDTLRLGVVACGMEESFEILPDDDAGYEAVIAEVCGCERTVRTAGPGEHQLYMLAAL